MCLWLSYKKKYGGKKFFCILIVTKERSRIRSWIRIHYSEVRIRGSRSRMEKSRSGKEKSGSGMEKSRSEILDEKIQIRDGKIQIRERKIRIRDRKIQIRDRKNPDPGKKNPDLGWKNPDTKSGMKNSRSGMENPDPGKKNPEPGKKNPDPGWKNPDRNPGWKNPDPESRIKKSRSPTWRPQDTPWRWSCTGRGRGREASRSLRHTQLPSIPLRFKAKSRINISAIPIRNSLTASRNRSGRPIKEGSGSYLDIFVIIEKIWYQIGRKLLHFLKCWGSLRHTQLPSVPLKLLSKVWFTVNLRVFTNYFHCLLETILFWGG